MTERPSDGTDGFRRGSLLALDDFEFDALALGQAPGILPGDGGVVHEHILGAVIRGDETEPFFRVEPFHLAYGHRAYPLSPRDVLTGPSGFPGPCTERRCLPGAHLDALRGLRLVLSIEGYYAAS